MSRLANRRMKDRKRRRKLRARLEAQGVSEKAIVSILDQKRRDDRQARTLLNVESVEGYNPANDAGYYPDDSKFRPTPVDPLLKGAARVTGMTAKVVRRGETITEYQYRRAVGETPDS